MSIEAMKQWLSVLKAKDAWGSSIREAKEKAITSLEQAIAEAEKQEPVAWKTDDIELYVREDKFGFYNIPLYTRPQPKREWVWLTPEEITALKHNGKRYISSQDFARAVEALSKEKNT